MNRFHAETATGRSLALPLLMLIMVLATMTLPACNTVKGAGQDMQAAGTAVEREAKDANK